MMKELVEYEPIPYKGKVSAIGKPPVKKTENLRSLTNAVGAFYLLEEMGLENPQSVNNPRYMLYIEDISQAMFDYLLLACWGESQYAHKSGIYFDANKLTNNKTGGYEFYNPVCVYNPLELIPAMEANFLVKGSWSGGFGGSKWAAIAKALGQYYKFPKKVWFDHVVNLSHNGGLAFDKGFVWQEPGKKEYIGMLDIRREGSLLESLDKAKCELGWLFYCINLSQVCPPLYERIQLGDKSGLTVFQSYSSDAPDEEDGEESSGSSGPCGDKDCTDCYPKSNLMKFKVTVN